MSISQDKLSKEVLIEENVKITFVDRPSQSLHEQLMNEIIKGICLKKAVKLAPKKGDVSNELSTILKRRMAFELSSSSNESILCNDKEDDWSTS